MPVSHGRRTRRFAIAFVAGAASIFAACSVLMAVSPRPRDGSKVRGGTGLTGSYSDDLRPPLSLVWRHTVRPDPYASSPAVTDKTAFFASSDRMYAVDAKTGALKWKYPADPEPFDTVISVAPAVEGELVYFGGGNGRLYAIHVDTGKIRWIFDSRSSISASPVIEGGVVYFGTSDGRVWAVDAQTGQQMSAWKQSNFKATDEIRGAPAIANGLVYVISQDQALHALGQTTGKLRGTVRLGGMVRGQSPVVDGEYLYAAAGRNVRCFLARTLALKWTQFMPDDVRIIPSVSNGVLYAVTESNRIYALDARNGRPKWKEPIRVPEDVSGPPAICRDTIYVVTSAGAIFAYDLANGAMRWSYYVQPTTKDPENLPTAVHLTGAPVVANNALYVLSDDGALSMFSGDAIDTTPPKITPAYPEAGIVINGAPPIYFEATIVDEGSGLMEDSIRILVDGEPKPRKPDGRENEGKPGFEFEAQDNLLTYETEEPQSAGTVRPLSDGRHIVTVEATDWMGNTARKSWSFKVDNSVNRSGRKKIRASSTNPGGLAGPGAGRAGSSGRQGNTGRRDRENDR